MKPRRLERLAHATGVNFLDIAEVYLLAPWGVVARELSDPVG